MDLKVFEGMVEAQDAGTDVEILHPVSNEKLGIKVKVAGPDSSRVRSARRSIVSDRLKRPNPMAAMTPAESEAENLRLAAAHVLSWDNVEWDGKALECTTANVEKVFQSVPFIREQVEAVAASRASFMTG